MGGPKMGGLKQGGYVRTPRKLGGSAPQTPRWALGPLGGRVWPHRGCWIKGMATQGLLD